MFTQTEQNSMNIIPTPLNRKRVRSGPYYMEMIYIHTLFDRTQKWVSAVCAYTESLGDCQLYTTYFFNLEFFLFQ